MLFLRSLLPLAQSLALVLACTFLGLSSAGCADAEPPPTTPGASPLVGPDPGGGRWRKITSKSGGFVAVVPETTEEKAETLAGGLVVRTWRAKSRGAGYFIQTFELRVGQKSPPEELLQQSAESFFRGCKGELKERELVAGAAFPELRIAGICRGGVAVGSVHLHGDRVLLALVVQGPECLAAREKCDLDAKLFLRAFTPDP